MIAHQIVKILPLLLENWEGILRNEVGQADIM
jgi:hypothetical protein